MTVLRQQGKKGLTVLTVSIRCRVCREKRSHLRIRAGKPGNSPSVAGGCEDGNEPIMILLEIASTQ